MEPFEQWKLLKSQQSQGEVEVLQLMFPCNAYIILKTFLQNDFDVDK